MFKLKKEECFYYHGDSDNSFVIIVKKGEKNNVIALIYTIDANLSYIDNVLQECEYKTGSPLNVEYVKPLVIDLIIELDIWSKYYFPTFHIDNEQWYHKEDENDTCYMEMLYKVMKYAYNKAIEVTGLKTY